MASALTAEEYDPLRVKAIRWQLRVKRDLPPAHKAELVAELKETIARIKARSIGA